MLGSPFRLIVSFKLLAMSLVALLGWSFTGGERAAAQGDFPPVIEFQRGPSQATQTRNVTLGASVRGSGPLQYQWFKEGIAIPGATEPSLSIEDMAITDHGNYHFVVSNAVGSARSPNYPLFYVPLDFPRFWNDERRHIILGLGPRFVLNPLVRGPAEDLNYQWYHNDVALPGEIDPAITLTRESPIGNYHLVARNRIGAGRTPYYTFDIGTIDVPTAAWTWHIVHGSTVYFLCPGIDVIRRFDLETELFKSDLAVLNPDDRFTIIDDWIYYTTEDNSVRRMRISGEEDGLLYQFNDALAHLFGWGQFLFVQQARTAGPIRIDLKTLVGDWVGGSLWPRDFFSNAVAARGLNRVFAVGDRLQFVEFDENADPIDFAPGNSLDAINAPDRAWVLSDQSLIINESGSYHRTTDLRYAGAIGVINDLYELEDGGIVIADDDGVTLLDAELNETAYHPTSSPVEAVVKHGNRVFFFRQPLGPDDEITVNQTFAHQFIPREKAQIRPPNRGPLEPSFIFQDKRGELIMINPLHRSVEFWSAPGRGFSGAMTLADSPTHATYSAAWDSLILGYADGRVTKLDLSSRSTEQEEPFTHAPSELKGLAAAGDYLVLADLIGARESHLSYDEDGNLIDQLEWGEEFTVASWNPSSGRLFHNPDGNWRLSATSLSPDGTFVDHETVSPGLLSSNRTIAFSPWGDEVLVNSGQFFDTSTLQLIHQLESDLDAAVWLGYRLFTAKELDGKVQITRWGGSNYGQDTQALIDGVDPRLFVSPDGELLVTTRIIERTIFTVLDADLNMRVQRSHRGGDMLNDDVRLSNLSSRVNLASDSNQPLVVGFVIRGNQPLRLLLRAIGPGLADFDVPGFLEDPLIEIFDANTTRLATNDDWHSHNPAELSDAAAVVGAFPLEVGSGDAAILLELPAGAYTAHVSRARGGGQNVLMEVYDYSGGLSSSRLVNMSTRTEAGTGTNEFVAGFVVAGTSQQPVLVRAVGGALGDFSVPNPMSDPQLVVRNGSQQITSQNDDWLGDFYVKEASQITGAFPIPSRHFRDAAVLDELPPGPYTATVSSAKASEPGTVLVEIYVVD